ncbi:MAG: response regulator [Cyanobacteria bacterium SZAS-4]|nr:response regulator [Cyanobacteria bacterium SZAS-4]
MKLTTKIILSFVTTIAIIVAIGCIDRRNTDTVAEAQSWVEHTHNVIEMLDSLEIQITNMTSRVRGFVITSDDRFIGQSFVAVDPLREQIAEIRKLTSDNAKQQSRLSKLESLLIAQVEYLNQVIATRRSQGFDQARKLITGNGLTNIVPIHEIITELGDDEKQLLRVRTARLLSDSADSSNWALWASVIGIVFSAALGILMAIDINRSIRILLAGMSSIGGEDGSIPKRIDIRSTDEFRSLADGFNLMSGRLQELSRKEREQDWLKTSLNEFAHKLQGQRNLSAAGQIILSHLAEIVGSKVSAIYGIRPSTAGAELYVLSSYGCNDQMQKILKLGEGLVGQAAKDQKPIILNDVATDALLVRTALTETTAAATVVMPILYEAETKAVLEVASLRKFTDIELEFLNRLSTWLGILFHSIEKSHQTELLLGDTQVMNEELVSQQEELRQLNEELEQKAEELDIQNQSVAAANYELEVAQRSVERTVEQLAAASKYKSDFLANMSHDLRTPLNSLLILSGLLADNQDGNLHEDQVEFAKSISSSGKTLLSLVDNILDLSKIESGVVKWDLEEFPVSDIVRYVDITFRHMAEQKNIAFTTNVASDAPMTIVTDERRLQQLLTNLLSNAFKFTEKGSVNMSISCADVINENGSSQLALKFSISDSGIGIPEDKQAIVFDAFQQADGSTKRKYGGTGLGLAICKQIALGLGGDLVLESKLGSGSTFTFILPIEGRIARKKVLVVEDNSAQRDGLVKMLESSEVEVFGAKDVDDALSNLNHHRIDCMVLDLGLGGQSGYDLIGELQQNVYLRELPVIVYTAREISREEETILRKSSHAIIMKSANSVERLQNELSVLLKRLEEMKDENDSRKSASTDKFGEHNQVLAGRNILIVDDDARNIFALTHLLERHDVNVSFAESGKEAIEVLDSKKEIELVLMDIMMPDMDGCETISILRKKEAFKHLPILAVTAKAMKGDRQKCLDAGASDYITKPIDTDKLLSLLRIWLSHKQ